MHAPGGKALATTQHYLGPADLAGAKLTDRALPDQPAAVDPDEQAWLDPVGELADRPAHQVRSRRGVDRDIFVGTADAVDRVDRNPHQPGRSAQPEFGFERALVLAISGSAEVSQHLLELVDPLPRILGLELLLG